MFVLFNLAWCQIQEITTGFRRSVYLFSGTKGSRYLLGSRQFAFESEERMRRTSLLLIFAAASAATAATAAASPDYECLSNNGSSGISIDPNDCAGFIMCSNGIPYEMDCPKGTLFSAALLVCDFPHNVDCDGRPQDGL